MLSLVIRKEIKGEKGIILLHWSSSGMQYLHPRITEINKITKKKEDLA